MQQCSRLILREVKTLSVGRPTERLNHAKENTLAYLEEFFIAQKLLIYSSSNLMELQYISSTYQI